MSVNMSSPGEQPVVRDLASFDRNSGNPVERILFNNRFIVVVACALLTLLLGFQAAKLKLNASFEDTIPASHRGL